MEKKKKKKEKNLWRNGRPARVGDWGLLSVIIILSSSDSTGYFEPTFLYSHCLYIK